MQAMTDREHISIDCMGGDNGPGTVMDGVKLFADEYPQAKFTLHGDRAVLQSLVAARALVSKCHIEHADKEVSMDQKPAQALRSGRGSSMWNAIYSVRSGQAAAVVSAGNTGALMAMSKVILRTIEGLHRPALVASWPSRKGMVAILDVGADVSANSLQLAEFAVLGDTFSRAVHHRQTPRIGILNIGSEDFKGFKSLREAGTLIEKAGLNYQGFIESSEICSGAVDVVVTNGFAGNVAIKSAEGAAGFISTEIREAFGSSLYARLVAILAMPVLMRLKQSLDTSRLNGAVFAGLRGIAVKSHGSASADGFAQALRVAHDMAGRGFDAKVSERLLTISDLLEGKALAT